MDPRGDDGLRRALRLDARARRTPAPATPIAIASYLGASDSFDRALATFAEAYADQNERDYEALSDAAASGRIAVETGL